MSFLSLQLAGKISSHLSNENFTEVWRYLRSEVLPDPLKDYFNCVILLWLETECDCHQQIPVDMKYAFLPSFWLQSLKGKKKKNFVQKSIMVSDFLFDFEVFFLILKILKKITKQSRTRLGKFYNTQKITS